MKQSDDYMYNSSESEKTIGFFSIELQERKKIKEALKTIIATVDEEKEKELSKIEQEHKQQEQALSAFSSALKDALNSNDLDQVKKMMAQFQK